MVRIIWSSTALNHFKNILEYIEKDSPQNANKVAQKIWNEIQHLKSFPKLGRKIPEYNDENIRELFVYNLRIGYRIKDKEAVEIAAIHHSSQMLPEKL